MSRLVESLLPARLGSSFRWLVASSWTTNLGDGLALAAGPLLVASQTDAEILVAMAALLQWLPPLVVGPVAGAITDRVDRRRLVIGVDLARSAVLVVLALSLLPGGVPVGWVLAALFLLATAETFADNASGTLLPMLVRREDLVVGNARLQAGFIAVNLLAGPPLGAALFAAGMAWPFVTQALLTLAGALLVSRVVLPDHGRPAGRSTRIRQDVREGFAWTFAHPAVRTLVLTIAVFNVSFGAAWSVLVLYATQRLGLGPVGFGLVTTVQAAGGMLAILGYGWLTRRVSLSTLMKVGLLIETATHLALALTSTAWVALVVFFVFGAHAFVWSTTSTTIRQRAVPQHLQGRVGSVNLVGVYGGLVVGSVIGGLLAQAFGVVAPFWFAFVASGVFVVVIWRQLRHVAHTDDAPGPLGAGDPGSEVDGR